MSAGYKKIFIHGWATDSRVWKRQASPGSIFIDLPGHGGKRKWDEPTLLPAVKELSGCMSSSEPVIGVGWSLGCSVLMRAAALKAINFKGLILTGATPSFVEREDFPWGQKKPLAKKMLMDVKKNPADALKRFYALNFTEDELKTDGARDFLSLYFKPPAHFDSDGITISLKALMEADLRAWLKEIEVPVLLLHGSRDSVVPAEVTKYLKENLKTAELKLFENAGHAPFITKPERFNAAMDEFIKNL